MVAFSIFFGVIWADNISCVFRVRTQCFQFASMVWTETFWYVTGVKLFLIPPAYCEQKAFDTFNQFRVKSRFLNFSSIVWKDSLLMCFQSETSVVKFLQRRVDGAQCWHLQFNCHACLSKCSCYFGEQLRHTYSKNENNRDNRQKHRCYFIQSVAFTSLLVEYFDCVFYTVISIKSGLLCYAFPAGRGRGISVMTAILKE